MKSPSWAGAEAERLGGMVSSSYDSKDLLNLSSLASKGYPEEANLLLDALFGEFTNCYIEIRLLSKGMSPFQFFYSSMATIQWGLIRSKNSEGYNCYFGVCLRKAQKGDKSSVASISALWADIDAKDFPGGKSEALAQLQKLPPYLLPSIIVDTGHGYHPYWLLREAELIESSKDILRLEAYMKGLALTLNGDSTSDLSRVLRIPGLVNQKDAKNPCLCHIIHWQPERRFNPMDFDDYRAEIREAPESKPKRAKGARRERADEFNTLAIGKLIEHCKFIQHCSDDAETLPESRWWSMCQILSFLGKPGKEKAHELSKPYPKYTEAETNRKLEYAREAGEKEIRPHTCKFIEQDLGFSCPEDCLAKKWGLKSPVVLATRLAKQEQWRLRYLLVNDKGKVTGVNTKALVDDLLAEFTFKTIFGIVRDDILVYENGIYTPNGEKVIREECEARVGVPMITTHTIHEIRDRIGGQTFTDRERFNTEKYIINVENGLLNVNTRELTPHTRDFLSTIRIPITYDPGAKCPQILKFLKDILPEAYVNTILEFFGYALIPDYSIPVVLILLGSGANGKSQLFTVLRRFIGQANCCSISIRNIKDYPFTLASLEGKLLNIQGDLSGGWFQDLNTLKMLTGQDPLSAPRKYKDTIDFDNFARLTFASNQPPKIKEDTLAIWRRILMISCPNEFRPSSDNFVKSIGNKISTPEELSGLLNLALDGLDRLFTNNDFTYEGTYEDRSRHYTMASDPARVFVDEYCDIGPEFKILKSDLYEVYIRFSEENKVQLKGEAQFGKELRQVPGLSISDKQYQERGERVRWWLGIKVRPVPKEEEVKNQSETSEPDIDMEV